MTANTRRWTVRPVSRSDAGGSLYGLFYEGTETSFTPSHDHGSIQGEANRRNEAGNVPPVTRLISGLDRARPTCVRVSCVCDGTFPLYEVTTCAVSPTGEWQPILFVGLLTEFALCELFPIQREAMARVRRETAASGGVCSLHFNGRCTVAQAIRVQVADVGWASES